MRTSIASCPPVQVDETCSGARLRLRRDRCVHLAARIPVRSLLSRHAPGLAPADWRFRAGGRGKARVAGPTVAPRLHFNPGHTAGVVAMALSVAHDDVRVDVERPERPVDAVDLAQRFFAPEEAAAVRAAPPGEAGPRSVGLWTLKERYRGDDEADWSFASVEAPAIMDGRGGPHRRGRAGLAHFGLCRAAGAVGMNPSRRSPGWVPAPGARRSRP